VSLAERIPLSTSDAGSGEGRSALASPVLSPSLVTLSSPLSVAAESIRALRTYVVGQHIDQGRRALAICGPSPGVGCTFVATNLAVSLAQVGLKTLLVDADLRAPSVQNVITPAVPSGGLSACLANAGAEYGDHIDYDVLPHLSLFYAGERAANAQDLLAREWFQDLLQRCMRDFDITIIDTPPANGSADARRISHVAGYSLVVARRNRSLVSDVKTLVTQLMDDDVTVVGTLLNAD
jgi:protein-tyrosine kinase